MIDEFWEGVYKLGGILQNKVVILGIVCLVAALVVWSYLPEISKQATSLATTVTTTVKNTIGFVIPLGVEGTDNEETRRPTRPINIHAGMDVVVYRGCDSVIRINTTDGFPPVTAECRGKTFSLQMPEGLNPNDIAPTRTNPDGSIVVADVIHSYAYIYEYENNDLEIIFTDISRSKMAVTEWSPQQQTIEQES